ncbi:MAG: cell division protein FtsL [Burkholderiales bacterium]|jgi:cell division protein FtsL|nr:cell division protein FtsL [Burkholderiales bacterium]
MVRTGVLLLLLVACALSLVTSRHQARKLFVELERSRQQAQAYEVDYGRLQIELSTWSVPSRIDQLARGPLAMQLPEPGRIQVIEVAPSQIFSRERGQERGQEREQEAAP